MGAPLRRDELLAVDVGGGHGREEHVAARRVEAAGERVEQREGAGELGDVGVLLDPAPGEVGDGPRLPEQAGRLLDLFAWNPGDRLDRFRGVAPAEIGGELERGPAGKIASRRGNGVLAEEGRLGAVPLVAAGRRIVEERLRRGVVPGDVPSRATLRGEVALGQQAAGVRAHEQRAVGPVADEGAVVPAALDHDAGDAEGERAVAAGPHPQPEVGLIGEPDAAGIDDDQSRAALQRRDGGRRVGEAGEAGVVAPEEDAAGVLQVGHGRAAAEPEADAEGEERRPRGPSRTAPSRGQRFGEPNARIRRWTQCSGVGDRGGGGRGAGKDDALGAVLVRPAAAGSRR